MRTLIWAIAFALPALPALAQQCGGDFGQFVSQLQAEAINRGHAPDQTAAFFAGVRQDQRVLQADRAQSVFRAEFTDFAGRLISQNRLDSGRANFERHRSVFDRAAAEYGVSPGILLAFWAFESDYGAFQGNFNTRDALVTLAHDCRRPELFRPQVFAALQLHQANRFDPQNTTGAWAGETGMLQMMPTDILTNAVDGDGDGRVDLAGSVPDAVLSGANTLRSMGWRAGEPWLHEVTVPATLDWSLTGVDTQLTVADWQAMGVAPRHGSLPRGDLAASVIVPQGRFGPAFMVFPNFNVLFEWNQSFIYVVTTAYFATRLEGAPVFDPGNPEPGLSPDDILELQRRLTARGYDTGGMTGILGANTRAAVQDAQSELGMPADAWPTRALLDRL